MSITTMSQDEFVRDLSQAKRAANAGPVLVTNDGQPAYALLNIEEYYRLAGRVSSECPDTPQVLLTGRAQPGSLLEFMQSIPGGDFEFEPPKLSFKLKPVEFE